MDHSTKPFIPIEVYKVDIEKLRKAFGRSETKNGRFRFLLGSVFPEVGNLFFVISDNAFKTEIYKDEDNTCIFPFSRSDEFLAFLKEEMKRTEFAENILSEYSGTFFDSNARILVLSEDKKRVAHFRHDHGCSDDMLRSYYSFLPIIIRLIGEQIA